MKVRVVKSRENIHRSADQKLLTKSSHVFKVRIQPTSKSILDNLRIIEEAERKGKRFCPRCGGRMKTCCDLHRQLNIAGHRPNGVHEGPEEWICLYCRIREYKDSAMRAQHGVAGRV